MVASHTMLNWDFRRVSGSTTEELNRSLVYLPRAEKADENDYFKNNERYCYRLSWLGGSYYKDNFDEVMDKNCSEHFDEKSEILCIDPMAVTGKNAEKIYIPNKCKNQNLEVTKSSIYHVL